ncbi:MAG: hypothetical protein U0S49_02595 [Rhodospirillales bacterium]|nr:hypothetical protein [Rhodospirillales bacterium]
MLSRTGCILTACLIATAPAADAALITVTFSGVVEEAFNSGIPVGSTISGSYTYDSETRESSGAYNDAIKRFRLGDSAYEASSGGSYIKIGDTLSFCSATALGGANSSFNVIVGGGNDLMPSRLITALPNFPAATERRFIAASSDLGRISGTLTSLAVVPVPAALPLMASAIGALAFAGAKRKRKRTPRQA